MNIHSLTKRRRTPVAVQSERSGGACHGLLELDAVKAAGYATPLPSIATATVPAYKTSMLHARWEVPHPVAISRAPRKFVDFRNDVAASDKLDKMHGLND